MLDRFAPPFICASAWLIAMDKPLLLLVPPVAFVAVWLVPVEPPALETVEVAAGELSPLVF